MFFYKYKTPSNFDDLFLLGDGEYLFGVYFEGSKDAKKFPVSECLENKDAFLDTIRWLDIYFSKKEADFLPKYKLTNVSNFTMDVLNVVKDVPYGKSVSYGEVNEELCRRKNLKKMSSQAVGGAIGRNPLCLIIPCHRVIGKDCSLVGYGGGLSNKIELLKLENIDFKKILT